jgi:hypothetical protein
MNNHTDAACVLGSFKVTDFISELGVQSRRALVTCRSFQEELAEMMEAPADISINTPKRSDGMQITLISLFLEVLPVRTKMIRICISFFHFPS